MFFLFWGGGDWTLCPVIIVDIWGVLLWYSDDVMGILRAII